MSEHMKQLRKERGANWRKEVTTIQPTLTRFTAVPITEQRRRKVAAYARVSTDHEEQQSSYEAQVDYYTRYHPEPCRTGSSPDVYADEGITGTSTKQARRLQADGELTPLAGKIDLIVTKSVSRFARNTVDSLTHGAGAEGALGAEVVL